MKRRAFVLATALAVLGGATGTVWGQMSSSSGMFGNTRSIGQAMGGATSSAFGGQGFGTTSGLGGTGSRSGNTASRVTAIGSSPTVAKRYVSRPLGEFVGGDTSTIRTGMLGGLANASSNSNSMGYNMGGGGYRGNSNGANGTASSSNSGRLFYGLRVGPEILAPANPQLSAVVTRGLARSMRLPTGAPVEVSIRTDRTALLRGVVASAHDRELAEQLVRLEPGVAEVVNELQVAPTGATGTRPQGTPEASRPKSVPPAP
jgi:hypothetical protein